MATFAEFFAGLGLVREALESLDWHRTVGEVRDDEIANCLRTPQGGGSVQFLVDCRSCA